MIHRCFIVAKEYHRLHPTISFRCQSIAEYEAIKNMVVRSGKSESTYIRELLLGVEKTESQSFTNGYNQGFNKFAVACPHCNKSMIFDAINNQETGQKILEIFGKFYHTECL